MGRVAAAVLVAAVALSCAGLYGLQTRLDEYRGTEQYVGKFMRLPDARQLKTASLGYEALTADLLWLKAVQHLGERKISSEGYEWLYKALDTVTSLDPLFVAPYEVGGLALTIVGDNVELSNKLLLKGYRHNPGVWQLPFYLGFNYMYYQKRYKLAAKYIADAARIEGSPRYLPLLASRLYTQAEDPAYALEFLLRMYESTKDERMRERMLVRINLLRAEVDARNLQKAADYFRARYGRGPANLNELVRAGIIRAVPEEPNGGRYYIDKDGTVKSNKAEAKLGVYTR